MLRLPTSQLLLSWSLKIERSSLMRLGDLHGSSEFATLAKQTYRFYFSKKTFHTECNSTSNSIISKHPLLRLLEQCKSMKQMKQIHARMVSIGLVHNGYAVGKLLCFCAFSPSGSLNYANLIFSQSDRSNTFLWNTMIRAHSRSSVPEMGIIFYNQMLGEGNVADKYTYPFAIRACARVGAISEGRVIHGRVLLVGLNVDDFISSSLVSFYADCGLMAASHQVFDEIPHKDVVTWTALVAGYAQCRELGTARQLFDEMSERNLVSWNAMINGYVQSGCFKEALNLFQELQGTCLKPNDVTLTSVLSACTHLGALDLGRWVHFYIDRESISWNVNLGTALVNMYARCGCIDGSLQVFHKMPHKDLLAWNAMIGGLAINGHGKQALDLFENMISQGIMPNDVTFISVLNACSHLGLVDEGMCYFNRMSHVHSIPPRLEHYGCMVDLLGRAGLLQEAIEVIESMPIKPDAVVWRSLLGACNVHSNFELGELIVHRLQELEPNDGGDYVSLSNIYAATGKWVDAERLRNAMVALPISRKTAGCSLLELNGVVHEFLVRDRTHILRAEIYETLDGLTRQLKWEET